MFEPGKLKEIVGEPVADAPLEVKADPYGSLPHFTNWLAQQDQSQAYNFYCTDGSCLIGHYSEAHGHGQLPYWRQAELLTGPPDQFGWTPIEYLARATPWTFGAALSRARALRDAL